MARGVALLLLHVVISFSISGITVFGQAGVQTSLSTTYYNTTCPNVQNIVDQVINQTVSLNRNIVGGLLRLHFHDCFVRGCDASVLIDSTSSNQAEKDGLGNINSLRGFEVIDSVKSALEIACPGVVSCADILALVARSSVFMVGGPNWFLPLGRRDGNVSNGNETAANLPNEFLHYSSLVDMFATKGLDEQDMVILAGAHTIGNTHCNIIEPRLYNFSKSVPLDPSLDPTFAAQLESLCPFSNGTSTTIIPMDFKGNDNFDSTYYTAVQANRGIFISDATLLTNATGAQIVAQESSNAQFLTDFALSMTKMGNIQVLLAPDGDVRLNCHVFNPPGLAPTAGPTAASTPSAAASTPTPDPSLAQASPANAPAPSPSRGPVSAAASTPTPDPALAQASAASTPASTPAQGPVPAAASSPTPDPALAHASAASTPAPTPALAPVPTARSANNPTPTLGLARGG